MSLSVMGRRGVSTKFERPTAIILESLSLSRIHTYIHTHTTGAAGAVWLASYFTSPSEHELMMICCCCFSHVITKKKD